MNQKRIFLPVHLEPTYLSIWALPHFPVNFQELPNPFANDPQPSTATVPAPLLPLQLPYKKNSLPSGQYPSHEPHNPADPRASSQDMKRSSDRTTHLLASPVCILTNNPKIARTQRSTVADFWLRNKKTQLVTIQDIGCREGWGI